MITPVSSTPAHRTRSRPVYALAVVGVIAAGLASRRYPHVLPRASGQYPGDVLWALMVYLGVAFVFPRSSSGRIAFLAGAFAIGIEFLKLSQTPWLVGMRQTTPGRLVLGQVFSGYNLIAYAAGIGLGFACERFLHRSR